MSNYLWGPGVFLPAVVFSLIHFLPVPSGGAEPIEVHIDPKVYRPAPHPTAPEPAERFVSRVLGAEVEVRESNPGPLGLDALVVSSGDAEPFLIYVDPARELLFAGAVFDAQGSNLSAAALQAHLERHSLAGLSAAVQGLPAVEEGRADAPILSVFAHLDCPYCAQLHEELSPEVAAGRLRVRWLLGSGRDPFQAAVVYRDHSPGGLEPIEDLFDAGNGSMEGASADLDKVQRVDRQMREFRITRTPYLVFTTRSGSNQTYAGVPDQGTLNQILATLL